MAKLVASPASVLPVRESLIFSTGVLILSWEICRQRLRKA